MAWRIEEKLLELDREELVQLMVEQSGQNVLPLEYTLLSSSVKLTSAELMRCWKEIFQDAIRKDKQKDDMASDMLAEASNFCFDKAKQLHNEVEATQLLEYIQKDLISAAEEYGIGMEKDQEWMYLAVEEEIRKFLNGKELG